MLASIVATMAVVLSQHGNLLINSDFSQKLIGWGDLYTRDAGTGTAAVVDCQDGIKGVEVVQSGEKDWAFAAAAKLAAEPDDVFEISAWVKSEGTGSYGISVVTLYNDDKTIDWEYGAARVEGAHDWQLLKRRIVLPKNCGGIRFRLVGYGAAKVWMDRPSLVRLGKIEDFLSKHIAPVTLKSSSLKLKIAVDGSLSATTVLGKTWDLVPRDSSLRVKSLVKKSPSQAELSLFNFDSDQVTDVKISLNALVPEMEVQLNREGAMAENLAYPGSIHTTNQDRLIVPMNEGIQFPANDPEAPSLDLVTYGGHGICMPWFGVEDVSNHSGVIAIYETPDDALFRMDRSVDHLLEPGAVWQPSRHEFRYPRRMRLSFVDKGGYVAMAKRYRSYAKEKGLLVTLREKAKANPYVDRLVGAMNVWNWDMNPVELGKEMSSLGMKRILWSRGGSAEEMKTLNDLGFLTSKYDIYQDVYDPKVALPWMNTSGWPDSLVKLENGDWMKGWAHPDKQPDGTIHWIQGGVISSGAGLNRAKEVIPAELKTISYHCRFLDTTTASPWREDYNPLHPLSRSDDRKNKMALLDFCSKDLGLVVGSETGLDSSVPYLDYFEGMESLGPYRLPDAGTEMMAYQKPTPDFLKYQVGSFYRLPLWELVYHDCTVAQWYWGDASNKAPEVWDRRDLINILYGTAPLVMFDKGRWEDQKARIRKTYADVCGWSRQIGYEEMISHDYLTPDHSVQRSTFASGKSVIVNFGPTSWNGIASLGFELHSGSGK